MLEDAYTPTAVEAEKDFQIVRKEDRTREFVFTDVAFRHDRRRRAERLLRTGVGFLVAHAIVWSIVALRRDDLPTLLLAQLFLAELAEAEKQLASANGRLEELIDNMRASISQRDSGQGHGLNERLPAEGTPGWQPSASENFGMSGTRRSPSALTVSCAAPAVGGVRSRMLQPGGHRVHLSRRHGVPMRGSQEPAHKKKPAGWRALVAVSLTTAAAHSNSMMT